MAAKKKKAKPKKKGKTKAAKKPKPKAKKKEETDPFLSKEKLASLPDVKEDVNLDEEESLLDQDEPEEVSVNGHVEDDENAY